MKKNFLILLSALLLLPLLAAGNPPVKYQANPISVNQETIDLDLYAPAAVLMEQASGTIIYHKNSKEKMFPASMTKMMGMLLVLEHIQSGKMSFTDIVTCSSYAASMGGTQIFLQPGETMSVKDLFKSVSINSANDAMVALGEAVSGSTPEFIKLMNKRAKEIGMENTNFVNPTGFHHADHYSTAYDMALLGRQLLKFEDQVIQFSSQFEGYVREDTNNPFWLVNTNKLVKYYPGMDGLKTGYTSDSMYCLTATAKRDNLRFISVVMREDSIDHRSQDTVKLLDYGFANYQSLVINKKDEKVLEYQFANARNKNTPVLTRQEVRITLKKGDKFDSLKTAIIIEKTNAPIKANTTVGYIEITNSDGWKFTYDLYIKESVGKSNWWDFFIKTLRQLFA